MSLILALLLGTTAVAAAGLMTPADGPDDGEDLPTDEELGDVDLIPLDAVFGDGAFPDAYPDETGATPDDFPVSDIQDLEDSLPLRHGNLYDDPEPFAIDLTGGQDPSSTPDA